MNNQQINPKQFFLLLAALAGWFAIGLSFCLIAKHSEVPAAETFIRFLSAGTSVINVVAALCFTFLAIGPGYRTGGFFARQKVLAVIAVYMAACLLVRNAMMAPIWKSPGLTVVADALLHLVMPVTFILYWLKFAPKNELKWKDALLFPLYSFVYILFVLIQGALTGFYPNPFLDVNQLSGGTLVLHVVLFVFLCFFLSLLIILISKFMSKR